MQHKNAAELFILIGNNAPIWYECHNSVKPNWYNGNTKIMIDCNYFYLPFFSNKT